MTAEIVPIAESQGAKVFMNCQVSFSIDGPIIAKGSKCRNVRLSARDAAFPTILRLASRLRKAMHPCFAYMAQSLVAPVRVNVRPGVNP